MILKRQATRPFREGIFRPCLGCCVARFRQLVLARDRPVPRPQAVEILLRVASHEKTAIQYWQQEVWILTMRENSALGSFLSDDDLVRICSDQEALFILNNSRER